MSSKRKLKKRGRKGNLHYQKKYLIALYDYETTETCMGVWDGVHDFSKWLGLSEDYTHSILHNHFFKISDRLNTPLGSA